jgi:putative IMPACT (imprinted ancient) family translation regulator
LVLSINYPGGRNKQISIRPEQKEQVERWLKNYHNVKDKLEEICELNHALLRPETAE